MTLKFKPEVLNLIDSAKPFLSPSGQEVIQSTQSLVHLLSSEAGITAIQSLRSLVAGGSTQETDVTGTTRASNPYSLFLVFYLLILASEDSTKTLPEQGDHIFLNRDGNDYTRQFRERKNDLNP
jgi:hypothetical protein